MITSYKDMKVYQRAYKGSLEIHKLSLHFPQHEQYELGAQIRRASKSIAMNIAEDYGRRASVADFKRFIVIALVSANEVRVQLDYCLDLGYINIEQHRLYANEYDAIGKMLFSIHQNWHKLDQNHSQ